MKKRSLVLLWAVLAGFGAASVLPASAETASQAAKSNYAPPVIRQKAASGLTVDSGTGQDAPAGAERLTVMVSGLVVEGGLPELAGATTAIEAKLKGKRVTGADLFAAARELEAAYATAGYILDRVSLPPQTVKNGMPLRLVVTHGYVERLDVSALQGTARKRVTDVLASLVRKPDLKRLEIERRLLLAGDIPGLTLKSTLKAGGKPGAAILVVEGRYSPVTVTSSIDNSSSASMGTIAASTGVDINNAFGLGEVFYLRALGYPGFGNDGFLSSDPRNRQLAAGFTLPIGTDGWWLGLEGLDSQTHPVSTQPFSLADKYDRLSGTLGYSWLRSRNGNLSTSASFDVANEDQTIIFGNLSTPFTSDRTRVLRVTQSGDVFLPWQAYISGNVTTSFGLDVLDARFATAALPLSRDGASPVFQKLQASARYSQNLANGRLLASLAATGQTGFGAPLVASQQLDIGGADWVSAYDGGLLQADNGGAMRAELTAPFNLPAGQSAFASSFAPYAFAAIGVAQLMKPAFGENGFTQAEAFGAGMRLGLVYRDGKPSAALTIEYAHGTSVQAGSSDRFNIRLTSTF